MLATITVMSSEYMIELGQRKLVSGLDPSLQCIAGIRKMSNQRPRIQ
jgi:hypothetical protein